MAKVTVVGAGLVGTSAAEKIVQRNVADVVLIDIVEGLAEGKALDIKQSAPVIGFESDIFGTTNYGDTAGSDVVVITAGLARKPGMTREDLLLKNAEIVGGIVEKTVKHSPDCIFVVVTNPMDVMAYLAWKKSGFDSKRVIGMGGVLDSARYAVFVSRKAGVPLSEVEALVLGAHGEPMVPVPSRTKVKGKPIAEVLGKAGVEETSRLTKKGGAQIVKLLKTGSAYTAPGASVSLVVEAVVRDQKRVLPCSVYTEGEYGIKDVYCGMPAKLGREGVIEIAGLDLTDAEKEALKKSAEGIRVNCNKL